MATFFAFQSLFIHVAFRDGRQLLCYLTVRLWCRSNSCWLLAFLLLLIFLLLLVLRTQLLLTIFVIWLWRLIAVALLRDDLLFDRELQFFSLSPFVGLKLLEQQFRFQLNFFFSAHLFLQVLCWIQVQVGSLPNLYVWVEVVASLTLRQHMDLVLKVLNLLKKVIHLLSS